MNQVVNFLKREWFLFVVLAVISLLVILFEVFLR